MTECHPATAHGRGQIDRVDCCETVEWIYLRKTGETAAYQLQGGPQAGRGVHIGLERGRSSAGVRPTGGRARPQPESVPKAPGSYFDTELDTGLTFLSNKAWDSRGL